MSSSTLPVASSTASGRMDPDEVTPPGVPATGTTVAQTLLQLSDAEARLHDAKRRVAEAEHAVSAAMRGELGADAEPES
jgi:hypothetical protein